MGKRALARVCTGCFTKVRRIRRRVARSLGGFRGGVLCGCVPNMRTFLGRLERGKMGVTVIADSGRVGVDGMCGTRPRLGRDISHVLATRVFARSGPSPRYFLLNTAIFSAIPRGYIIFRSSFRNLRTKGHTKVAIVKLTAAGSRRRVHSGTGTIVRSFGKFDFRGVGGVVEWYRLGRLPLRPFFVGWDGCNEVCFE